MGGGGGRAYIYIYLGDCFVGVGLVRGGSCRALRFRRDSRKLRNECMPEDIQKILPSPLGEKKHPDQSICPFRACLALECRGVTAGGRNLALPVHASSILQYGSRHWLWLIPRRGSCQVGRCDRWLVRPCLAKSGLEALNGCRGQDFNTCTKQFRHLGREYRGH